MSYCEVADIRAEGFTVADASDARVAAAIALADLYIDRMTGWWFEAREFDDDSPLILDGDGTNLLVLPIPIISISRVRLISRLFGDEDTTDLEVDDYLVYARHMTGQVVAGSDDRYYPRIRILEADSISGLGVFPDGPQTVQLSGVFGFTDPDEGYYYTATGITPPLIKHAAMLLAIRELTTMRAQTRRATWRDRDRIVRVATRDQSYSLAEAAQRGWATGDLEIDRILTLYSRPPKVASS